MIRRRAKKSAKRQHENAEGQQCKKQRIESSAEPVRTTKIIDLNDDCLLKMFSMLDLQSLFDVAVANEYLRPAARDVYKCKFGKKLVKIYPFDGRFVLKEGDDDILVRGLKTSLQYLRCFGASIHDLSIQYNYSKTKRYKHVHEYIEQYCGENLKAICIDYSTGFGNESSLEKIIADLLHGNRQLKSLKIYDHPLDDPCIPMDAWLKIIKDQSSLNELHIDTLNVGMTSAQVQWIVMEHPGLIVLNLPNYDLMANDVNTLLRQLKSLKKVEISLPHSQCGKFRKEMDSEWYGYRILTGVLLTTKYKLQRDMP